MSCAFQRISNKELSNESFHLSRKPVLEINFDNLFFPSSRQEIQEICSWPQVMVEQGIACHCIFESSMGVKN